MLALAFLNQSLLKKKRKRAGEEVGGLGEGERIERRWSSHWLPACDTKMLHCFTKVHVVRHRP